MQAGLMGGIYAMKDLVLSRRQVLKGAGAFGVLGALGVPTTVFADGTTIRWDLIHINFAIPSLNAGGVLSAHAEGESKITLTGSGTFRPGDDGEVTGGGMWKTFDPAGAQTGGGTYQAQRLVKWDKAPGALPSRFVDNIGKLADTSAGLALLKISYSDGSRGVLTISCNLGVGAVFEGFTATKGFVDYFMPEPPATERTVFHITSSSED
jgi:hypothetical protein